LHRICYKKDKSVHAEHNKRQFRRSYE
jgi:hypothetical protein